MSCVRVFESLSWCSDLSPNHDDVTTWAHFPHYWPFVRGTTDPLSFFWRSGYAPKTMLTFRFTGNNFKITFILIESNFKRKSPWWRHQMETVSSLLTLCEENWPVTGRFPSQRASISGFDVFLDISPNKRWTNGRLSGDLRRRDVHIVIVVVSNANTLNY